jgi:hypothetical protein
LSTGSDEPVVLYEIIRQRYERAAAVLTSNRAVEEMPGLFGVTAPYLGTPTLL